MFMAIAAAVVGPLRPPQPARVVGVVRGRVHRGRIKVPFLLHALTLEFLSNSRRRGDASSSPHSISNFCSPFLSAEHLHSRRSKKRSCLEAEFELLGVSLS